MTLFLQSFGTHSFDVSGSTSVAEAKIFLANTDNLPLDNINLYHESSLLKDEVLLNTLPPNSTLSVEVPILGGKVHGSLARAGKVRSQTPKVDKQEKKKNPRGRAKRRLQYTKRFVAVVASTGGRRRGPNSNAKT